MRVGLRVGVVRLAPAVVLGSTLLPCHRHHILCVTSSGFSTLMHFGDRAMIIVHRRTFYIHVGLETGHQLIFEIYAMAGRSGLK